MKRYSNKELKSMSPEELEKLQEEALKEFHELGKKIKAIVEPKSESTEEKK